MGVQFEIHENLTESEIFEKLVETPRLCLLLNPELTLQQIGALTSTFCVVNIEHEGKLRPAVIAGFYKLARDEVVEPQIYDMWEELAEEEEEE